MSTKKTLVRHLLPFALLGFASGVNAQAGRDLPYIGFLEEDGVPADGPRDVSIDLFTAPSGGAPCVEEDFGPVDFFNGRFQVELVDLSDLCLGSGRLYAAVWIDGTLLQTDEAGGRARIGAVPFAAATPQGSKLIAHGGVYAKSPLVFENRNLSSGQRINGGPSHSKVVFRTDPAGSTAIRYWYEDTQQGGAEELRVQLPTGSVFTVAGSANESGEYSCGDDCGATQPTYYPGIRMYPDGELRAGHTRLGGLEVQRLTGAGVKLFRRQGAKAATSTTGQGGPLYQYTAETDGFVNARTRGSNCVLQGHVDPPYGDTLILAEGRTAISGAPDGASIMFPVAKGAVWTVVIYGNANCWAGNEAVIWTPMGVGLLP